MQENTTSSNAVIHNRHRKRHCTHDERARHVESWKKSGLSKADYARQHGLVPSCLRRWVMLSNDRQTGFKPVRVTSSATSPVLQDNTVEIITSQQIRIRLSNVQNASLIVGIVRGLTHAADH